MEAVTLRFISNKAFNYVHDIYKCLFPSKITLKHGFTQFLIPQDLLSKSLVFLKPRNFEQDVILCFDEIEVKLSKVLSVLKAQKL